MNNIKVFQANAFTSSEHLTLGNPAAVVFTEEMMTNERMSEIAKLTRLPMTAFVMSKSETDNEFILRYFDPEGQECHICGHATVVTTQILVEQNPNLKASTLRFYLNPLLFDGKEEFLETQVDGQGKISISLPSSDLEARNSDQVLKLTVAKSLNIEPEFIANIYFSTNIRDYVVEISDPLVLEACQPDFNFMKDMANNGAYQHEGLMVTSKSNDDAWDIKVRVFLPKTGVNEDIACGSGNCSIIPYWYDKGFNPNHGEYKSVFPYPNDPENLGGIQLVRYSPENKRVTIICEAETKGSSDLQLSTSAGHKPKRHAIG